MISANDTTILAMLSRYPDMAKEEADEYISKIEHEENIPICHAVIGRISKEQLNEESQKVFEEFYSWSNRRTQRIREEQINARRRQQETQLSLQLNKMHEQGLINDQVLMLYGISGNLPDRTIYMEMSVEEKRALWEDRVETRLGPNWRRRFNDLGNIFNFLGRKKIEYNKINWPEEGF